ncbi:MAG: riboflavin biosynthesis protein RibF [Firmicutes bacterium]|nr:riboflavin biosynthesis protein RibF [Bacillota bacterium]
MIIIEDNFNKRIQEKTVIALGGFDGLHIGHRALIDKTISVAKKMNSKSMVFTFKNHPLTVINRSSAPKLLLNNHDKLNLLKSYGVDIVNLVNFDTEFMQMTPEAYIASLAKNYNAAGLVVGFNHRFGYKNLGDTDLLKALSKTHSFSLNVVSPVKYRGDVVSSSKIRNLLGEDGDVERAAKMLSRPYFLEGTVIRGKQLGRKIGFPTMNLDYNNEFVLPRGGVYYSILEHNNRRFKGITNIGYNPTVENDKLSVETHIIGFDEDLYDEIIKINFIKRIRDEKKFNSLLDLSEQLKKDKLFALKQNLDLI